MAVAARGIGTGAKDYLFTTNGFRIILRYLFKPVAASEMDRYLPWASTERTTERFFFYIAEWMVFASFISTATVTDTLRRHYLCLNFLFANLGYAVDSRKCCEFWVDILEIEVILSERLLLCGSSEDQDSQIYHGKLMQWRSLSLVTLWEDCWKIYREIVQIDITNI